MTGAVRLVVGVGARRGVSADEVLELVGSVLREAGLPPAGVVEVATVDSRAAEPGLVEAAARLGVPLRGRCAEELARVAVLHPSEAVRGAVGTPSVAEAAALAGGGELLVPKRKRVPAGGAGARVTCAVVARSGARLPVRGPGYTGGDATFGLPARP
ncbi:cobalamin biosynthesis protein [Streptomyces sp. CC53]|uniref:cobalamin biosynthesis protein n=1 Tax=unclassified Streptomyces TaxID=2593676 RepID=UPI000ADAFF30